MSVRSKTLAPEWPFRATMCGASGSGKTYTLSRLLLSKAGGFHDKPILWIAPKYSLEQDAVKALEMLYGRSNGGPGFTTIDGSGGWSKDVQKEVTELLERKPREQPLLIVIDDMLAAKGRAGFVSNLYTTGRHLSCSIIELTQRIFPAEKGARTQRLNCTAFWLFSFPGSGTEVGQLVNQLEPDKARRQAIKDVYKEIVSDDPHGYLYVDLVEPEDSPMRWRDSSLDTGIVFD